MSFVPSETLPTSSELIIGGIESIDFLESTKTGYLESPERRWPYSSPAGCKDNIPSALSSLVASSGRKTISFGFLPAKFTGQEIISSG